MRDRRRIIAFSIGCICLGGYVAASGQPPDARKPPVLLARHHLAPAGVPWLIDGSVNDTGLLFLVDFNNTTSVLDERAIPLIGPLLADYQQANGAKSKNVRMFAPGALRIGEALYLERAIAVIDLEPTRVTFGRGIGGVLGCDFLSQHVVMYDSDERELSLYDRTAITDLLREKDWKSVPMAFGAGGRPTIDLRLPDGSTEPFVIESGSPMTGSLSPEVCNRLRHGGFARTFVNPYDVNTTKITNPLTELSTISIGGFSNSRLRFWQGEDCRLGMYFFVRYACIFDFPNRRLYLRKSSRYDIPDRPERMDIVLAGRFDDLRVQEIRGKRDSGLREGDQFVSIADIPAEECWPRSIYDYLILSKRDKVDVAVLRNAAIVKLQIKLDD